MPKATEEIGQSEGRGASQGRLPCLLCARSSMRPLCQQRAPGFLLWSATRTEGNVGSPRLSRGRNTSLVADAKLSVEAATTELLSSVVLKTMSSLPARCGAYGFDAPYAPLLMTLGGACLLALSVTRLWLSEGRPAIVSTTALAVA